jgi:hypothetical protein
VSGPSSGPFAGSSRNWIYWLPRKFVKIAADLCHFASFDCQPRACYTEFWVIDTCRNFPPRAASRSTTGRRVRCRTLAS